MRWEKHGEELKVTVRGKWEGTRVKEEEKGSSTWQSRKWGMESWNIIGAVNGKGIIKESIFRGQRRMMMDSSSGRML